MAQIVTITNPLTGQPAQVDQLDHTAQQIDDAIARAIPGGAIDTLLAGKAPAGYGLGTNFNELPGADDANLITKFGYYTVKDNTPTGNWCYVLHLPYGDNRATQFAFIGYAGLNDIKYCYCKREKINDEWKPWEWVNPPMQLGVEYRTTERYLGKPVYAKVIEAGFNPAGTTKNTLDKTVSASGLVRFSASHGGWSFPSLMYGGNYSDVGNVQVAVQATSAGIHVTTFSKARDMTKETVNVSVYYTKD